MSRERREQSCFYNGVAEIIGLPADTAKGADKEVYANADDNSRKSAVSEKIFYRSKSKAGPPCHYGGPVRLHFCQKIICDSDSDIRYEH